MMNAPFIESYLQTLDADALRQAFLQLLPESGTREERVATIARGLASPSGRAMRSQMGRWIVDRLLPVEHLVPQAYAAWRAPVRDAMLYVVDHLSDARLAPKLLEQLELPPRTSAEERLLLLIAKVPGLQKLGQVLARNQQLRPSLRRALERLENGIRDSSAGEIRGIIEEQLGDRLERYAVRISARNLSEASVSAVVRFTARDPLDGTEEHGVFKVLKPHVPSCFAEDMELLHNLARHFAKEHRRYGARARLIPDTFRKVRRLLRHEVDFVREQQTLLEAGKQYEGIKGIRVPRVIRPLCTATITAITEEKGSKVTQAAKSLGAAERGHLADQLVDALLAVPLFADSENALFHVDPHAGNLLYDQRSGELVIIDWALREHLTRLQRRRLAMLFVAVGLRDPLAATEAIAGLAEKPPPARSAARRKIALTVRRFLDATPLLQLPTAVDAMRLLEQAAYQGVRFPSPLIMLAKVLFTLDGILEEIGGSAATMGVVLGRNLARRVWKDKSLRAVPLTKRDLAALECSALLYGGRLLVKGQEAAVRRWLTPRGEGSASR